MTSIVDPVVAGLGRLFDPASAYRPLAGDPKRYALLDSSRAVAAVAVLFWHYQHFYFPIGGLGPMPGYLRLEPGSRIFRLLYERGHEAVAIFWMISGFVFAAVYLPAAATTRAFVVNRFARLYPLHLLTLLVVAALQLIAAARFGRGLIYEYNDAYDFVLNLLFASSWGFERGFSFNGPIWSVSVEILVYAAFWASRRWIARFGVALPLAAAAASFGASKAVPTAPVFACGQYFMTGTALYIAYAALRGTPLLAIVLALAWPIGLWGLWRDYMVVGLPCCFGSVMLLLVWAERHMPARPAGLFQAIGDTTYGLYLWHVPVQLAAFLVLAGQVDVAAAASHPWFLAGFLATVATIAAASYRWFERPMRQRLRRFAAPRRGVAEAPIAAP